jgi:hypothetical protein
MVTERQTALVTLIALAGLAGIPAVAQTSASYRLEEHVFNAGGHPDDGPSPGSASFQISLDAIGEGLTGHSSSSASYQLVGGFGPVYPPPGEVTGLVFLDDTTLAWDPERSAGVYNLYRDGLGELPGLGYGFCEQSGLTGASAIDGEAPTAGDGYFYLVTVENRVAEEGTKGDDGDGVERGSMDACP